MNRIDLTQLERRAVLFVDTITNIELNLDNFANPLEQTDDFLVFQDESVVKIFDRTCDHNGGRLFARDGIAKCPLHGWRLDPQSGQYLDVNCTKQPLLLAYRHELDSPLITVESKQVRRKLRPFTNKYEVSVEFLNHACLLFTVNNLLTFATDPWVIGPAFCNGWWLALDSPSDVFNRLNNCDFIYISHNHPDHLHPESLSFIRKDIPILTAPFLSGSTVRYLQNLGFTTIITCGFAEELYCDEKQIAISVLKSGDFRDDSGLLVQLGEFSALLTVDSNYIDFGRVPESVDLLCSSFAGGASGYPLCFELYSEAEKLKIINRNKAAIMATNKQTIQRCSPKYFMPYAGFFKENAARDKYIRSMNKKNTAEDYKNMCLLLHVDLMDVTVENSYTFKGKQLINRQYKKFQALKQLSVDDYLQKISTSTTGYGLEEIKTYFRSSKFHGNLVLDLVLCNDDFSLHSESLVILFDPLEAPQIVDFGTDAKSLAQQTKKNYLRVKTRQYELINVCKNGLPWEDLSIGFQCRIDRHPDVYNSDFWFHFTNIYIHDAVNNNTASTFYI